MAVDEKYKALSWVKYYCHRYGGFHDFDIFDAANMLMEALAEYETPPLSKDEIKKLKKTGKVRNW